MTHYLSRKYGVVRLGRYTPFLFSSLLNIIALLCCHQIFLAQSDNPQEPPTALPYSVYLPLIHAKADKGQAVPVEPERPVEWDIRLTERGARLIQAEVAPGTGYWRLVKARWYNEAEAQGRHHIYIDLLDQTGTRITQTTITIRWADGATTLITEAKAGEPYAAAFDMHATAPAYSAQPDTTAPADRVEGMGLGTVEAPQNAIHTSYGLVWQWTIAGDKPTPTPTATLIPSLTPIADDGGNLTPVASPTLTLVPTAPQTVTPPDSSPTASPTPTPSPTSDASPTSTPTPTPTATTVAQAIVVGCQPNAHGSRFEGYVYVDQQPTNGYRVVFSYEADGPWVTEPALSGSGAPGFYTHIISVGVARAGNWYAWLVDQNRQRISTLAAFTTDGVGGACNVVSVNFLIQK